MFHHILIHFSDIQNGKIAILLNLEWSQMITHMNNRRRTLSKALYKPRKTAHLLQKHCKNIKKLNSYKTEAKPL